MLIVSEVAEALESDRKGWYANLKAFNAEDPKTFEDNFKTYIKDTFEDEIADTMIRLLDLCGALEIDIDTHIALKRKFNLGRGHKHGKKY